MPSTLLMGNEAFAWAALEAGVNVVAGYPGTPSSELIETVAKLHAKGVARDVYVEWSDNEKAALELLVGASACGARGLFTCKQMGLNVAADALLSANYVGVRGGLVLFVADDPGPISSQTEQDTRRFANFAKVPVLDPWNPESGADMMRHAFEASERWQTPVIVRPTTRVNHASTFFDVPDYTLARPVPQGGFEKDPKWVIFPRRSYAAHGEINHRLHEIASEEATGFFNPLYAYTSEGCAPADAGAASLGIVCGGVSGAYAREAIDMLIARGAQLPAFDFLQVGTPFPFPARRARAFAAGKTDILVFEELDHVLEDDLLMLAGRDQLPFRVHGKLDGSTLDRGENSVEDCLRRIARFLGVTDVLPQAPAPDAAAPTAPARPPVLCAGCPHRGAFYAVKRALRGKKNVLCGDIGCYTLGNAKPLEAVDTCLCMGAGITMAQGVAVAEPGTKSVAFIGDSTFFASGMTGVANAVYNRHDITIVVLDNSTTAMTGGQPHPGIGRTLMGPESDPIRIEAVLEGLGITCIEHANPLYLEESLAAARRAIDFEGPSALIFRSPCTQMVRPEPRAVVDDDACVGCRVCVASIGCPAMTMAADGSKMIVDPSTCYGCGLCVDVCPHDAISAAVRTEGRVPFAGKAGE